MFNPKKQEYINKTFRLPAELVKQLECIAQKNQLSLNAIIVQCCEYAINNMKPDEDSKQ